MRRQIATRVATAYWSALGSRRVRDVLMEEIQNFERVFQYNRDRVKEGAIAEVDLTRVEVERDRLSTSLQNASQESDRAWQLKHRRRILNRIRRRKCGGTGRD
jgi:cobalt-zinc-cadmium efflux system outer membrane protein